MPNAFVNATASGNTQVVAGVSGKRYRVIAYVISFGSTVNVKFQSASTDLTCLFYGILGAQVDPGSLELAYGQQRGHFKSNAGEDLNINLSGAGNVGIMIEYDVTD